MRITNNKGLPEEFVNLASDDERAPIPNTYHVTELVKPTPILVLERRHYDEIEVDAADCVWLVLGTAVHKVMEEANKDKMAELPFSVSVGGDTIAGRVDLYDEKESVITDWKTATVAKWERHDFGDYDKQGRMYAWGLMKNGKLVVKCSFVLMLKDWSPSAYRVAQLKGDAEYPSSAIQIYEFNIGAQDVLETSREIEKKLNEIHDLEQMPDEQMKSCEPDERWNAGDRYACGKGADFKRAVRVFDTMEEAKEFADANKLVVVTRHGEDRRCQDYCLVSRWCPFKKENEKNGN